jgi:phosphatidate phosphatase APP1
MNPEKAFIKNLQILELEKHAVVNGVMLYGKPKTVHQQSKRRSLFLKIVKSYFIKRYKNQFFLIQTGNETINIETDHKGEFSFNIDNDKINDLQFIQTENHEKIPIIQEYPKLFKKNEARFLLISDIDDTILVSKSARFFSKLWLMLFTKPAKRKPVLDTYRAYQKMNIDRVSFAYVSGSETNLLDLLTSFLSINEFPTGPIFLRPYVYWKDLLKGKDRESYKLDRIKQLIEYYPHQRIILFGDDSQQDYDVFTQLAAEYPEKIYSVFLRRTGLTKRFKGFADTTKLDEQNTMLYYYNSFEQIEEAVDKIIKEKEDIPELESEKQ